MAQPVLGNVYKTRFFCYDSNLTQVCINTVYLQVAVSPGIGTMSEQSMCDAVSLAFSAYYVDYLTITAVYYGCSMQLVNPVPATEPIPLFSRVGTHAGAVAGNPLPLQVSGVITIKTAFAGRHYRGRIYPGFLPASYSDATGAALPVMVTNMTLLANALQSTIAYTSGANIVNLFAVLRSAVQVLVPPAPKTVFYSPITSALPVQRFATQRRRGQYGRINSPPF